MPKSLPNGSTDVSTYFVLRDSTNHAPKADVTLTDIDLYYQEQGAAQAAKVDLTALDAADSAHADNKGYHCGNGIYRIDWPDAAFDGGVGKTVILIVVCSGVDTCYREIILSPQVDVYSLSGDATAADNAESMFDGTGYAGGTTKLDVNVSSIASGAITATAIATDAIDNDALAANAVTEIQSGLSTLDAAGIRTAVGLGSANLDTQLADLPTNSELATALDGADDAVLSAISGLNDFDPAADVVAHVTLVDTTTTNTDMVAAAPSAASVADAVWDEALSGHAEAGSAGAALAAADAPTASDNATAVWTAETRELTSAGAGGATAQEVWEYTTRELTDKAGFSLAVAYDAAKTAASQTSVNDIPTNSELATALAGADDAVLAAIGNLPTDADVQTAAAAALTAYDPPTKAELDSAVSPLATAAGVTALGTPLQAANYTAPDNAGIAAAEAAAGAAQTAAEAIVIPTDYAKAADVAALNNVSTAEVQTAATAALTAYDPPTRTEATSDKAEVIAALGNITVDVGDITATVDLTPVTAALEPIEAALAGLGAGAVTVVSPVTEDGEVIVYSGDDYSAEHGREIEFTVSDAAHALELDTATVMLKVREATWTATTVTSTATGYLVVFEPTRTETAALATIRQDFELEAELADGDVVTLATGSLTTKPDIPVVSS